MFLGSDCALKNDTITNPHTIILVDIENLQNDMFLQKNSKFRNCSRAAKSTRNLIIFMDYTILATQMRSPSKNFDFEIFTGPRSGPGPVGLYEVPSSTVKPLIWTPKSQDHVFKFKNALNHRFPLFLWWLRKKNFIHFHNFYKKWLFFVFPSLVFFFLVVRQISPKFHLFIESDFLNIILEWWLSALTKSFSGGKFV